MQHSVSENVFTGKNIKTIIRLFLVTVVLHDHHPPKPHMAGSLLCDYTVAVQFLREKVAAPTWKKSSVIVRRPPATVGLGSDFFGF